jgi:hypothetical protein
MQADWILEVAAGIMLKYEPGKIPVAGLAGGEDIRDVAAHLLRLAKGDRFKSMPEGVPWAVINFAGYAVRFKGVVVYMHTDGCSAPDRAVP